MTHPPLYDVLDWSKFSIFVDWRKLEDIEEALLSSHATEVDQMQAWLLRVRDAFIYDLTKLHEDINGIRKGPIYLSLLLLKIKSICDT